MTGGPLYLGLDLGTSGCRLCVADPTGRPLARFEHPWQAGLAADPAAWWAAVRGLLARCTKELAGGDFQALAVDGTSTTLLLCRADGEPLGPVLMYHDDRARLEAARIRELAPADAPVHGPGASLAKLLWLQGLPEARQAAHALHQADWITGCLLGRFGDSDENNCLKLGYDPVRHCWPPWLQALDVQPRLLPRVHPAGTPLGPLDAGLARELGLPLTLQVMAGTTDGVAAFLASGAARDEAVTSLGSTLILKIRAEKPVNDVRYGVYSHPLGDHWLAGGASNCGGAVLRQHFSDEELARMTPLLRPDEPTGLDYYPLPRPGERFPVSDPDLAPRLTPRPADPVRFFQGILEGIAAVEARGYRLLAELGAPYPRRVLTVGGGAANPAWTRIRARALGVPVSPAPCQEAACGAARLAGAGEHTEARP
ncbi:MAG TPA: carbohydrate kinase [Gammaproteobacteria bacterium]|nr:carbohydrate kinase [Gammaproteobacteria bacterium]